MVKIMVMKRVAIFGGTFNPVHLGHTLVAGEAISALSLDEVIFMPVFSPPHKDGSLDMAPPVDRLRMVELAIEGKAGLKASDMEIKRGGKSFTIDTLRELSDGRRELSLIIGADQFNELKNWHSAEEILSVADIAVALRPEVEILPPKDALPLAVAESYVYDATSRLYKAPSGRRVVFLTNSLSEASSTKIRATIREGGSVSEFLDGSVLEYIKKHNLYN